MYDDNYYNNGDTNSYNDNNGYGGENSQDNGDNAGYNTGSGSGCENNSSSQSGGYSYYNMNNQQTGGNGNQQYSGDSGQNNQKKPKKGEKKSHGIGYKIGIAALIAVIAGGIGGAAFYGVNYVGNHLIQNLSEEASSDAGDADDNKNQESGNSFFEDLTTPDTDSSSDDDESDDSTVSGSTTSSDNMTVQEVAAKCISEVVTISKTSTQELQSYFGQTQTYQSSSMGTGVIIGQNDTELLIATNYHVVSEADTISVGFVDESVAEAQVKGSDVDNDLAVIAVSLDDISSDTMSQISIATIGNADDIQLGEQVVAIGNSAGYGQSVTSGYISATGRSLQLSDGTNVYNATDMLQTDAAINAGNSGGPLYNMRGEVIGINEGKRYATTSGTSVEGMGYAISISRAEPILEELMSKETRQEVSDDEKGYLGVTCANVSSDVAQLYNMPEGICVTEVISGGPAEAAGIQKGDVITKIDGNSISTYDELVEQLGYYKSGETIDFVIMRANNGAYEEQTISVTLGDASVIEGYNTPNSSNN